MERPGPRHATPAEDSARMFRAKARPYGGDRTKPAPRCNDVADALGAERTHDDNPENTIPRRLLAILRCYGSIRPEGGGDVLCQGDAALCSGAFHVRLRDADTACPRCGNGPEESC